MTFLSQRCSAVYFRILGAGDVHEIASFFGGGKKEEKKRDLTRSERAPGCNLQCPVCQRHHPWPYSTDLLLCFFANGDYGSSPMSRAGFWPSEPHAIFVSSIK